MERLITIDGSKFKCFQLSENWKIAKSYGFTIGIELVDGFTDNRAGFNTVRALTQSIRDNGYNVFDIDIESTYRKWSWSAKASGINVMTGRRVGTKSIFNKLVKGNRQNRLLLFFTNEDDFNDTLVYYKLSHPT
jgi:hypothetical protein